MTVATSLGSDSGLDRVLAMTEHGVGHLLEDYHAAPDDYGYARTNGTLPPFLCCHS